MRLDNQAVTVGAGTATTNPFAGVYQYDISAIDPRYVYVASWKITSTFGTAFWAELINPTGTLTTRGQIRAEAARLMGLLITHGTTTSATSSAIADASGGSGMAEGLISDSDSIYSYDGCIVLMTSGPAAGFWREVSSGKFAPLTGTLTVATQWSASALPTAAGGDTYEVYAGLTPNQWSLRDTNSIIDLALQRCRYQRRTPLTLVADGDMEATGVAAWTPTNTSLVKSAIESVTPGRQAMLVINSAGKGYAQSNNIGVIPGHGYTIWGDYRCVGSNKSTAHLIVWDVTNNVQIADAETQDSDSGTNFEGGSQSYAFSAPSNCYAIAIRLQGTEANAILAWCDVILMTTARRRYNAPSWVQTRNQVQSFLMRSGSRPYEYSFQDVGWPTDIQEDPTAVNTFVLALPQGSALRPVYVMGESAYGPMQGVSDAQPTACPLEWAKYAAAREAFQLYARSLEGITVGRTDHDRKIIETRAAQLDNLYLPAYETANTATAMQMVGLEITRLPG